MSDLSNLEPKNVWKFFTEVLTIPRPSDHEEQIRSFLIDFAQVRNLSFETDAAGNLMIRKGATAGMENAKSVCLQSHLDMVCEQNAGTGFNFFSDPIQAYSDGEWIRAKGTTLGADDGIGIAAQMAVLDSNTLSHGPLECLFTTAEETGLNGAFGLEAGFVKSSILLNLDSEDEGELFIGCAGGIDLTAWFDFQKTQVPENYAGAILGIRGLTGGHSGDDIHKGSGNANKLLNRFLFDNAKQFNIRIQTINGGNLRNAIAREAEVKLAIPEILLEKFLKEFEMFQLQVMTEYALTDPQARLYQSGCDRPDWVLDNECQRNLLIAINNCPHGVISWSKTIPGLVETSTNLAAIKFGEKQIKVTTSQRSSVESAKHEISNQVETVFKATGAKTKKSTGYPGWNPNPDSNILKITAKAYKDLFGNKPLIKAIHAGLECGLFLEKYPELDMVSFGPTIKGVHSPDERLNIDSVMKFWKLLIEVLKRTT
jgi:dipeptidase D